jgi:3-carboxy-cis,cis-muconate cycloisomerase
MTDWLIESLVTTEPLAAAFSDAAILRAMVDFETGLARVEADLGLIPAAAAAAVAAASTDPFDVHAIARAARASATIVIPFVDELRERVRARDRDAATYLHWGATSQDVFDTALVLCIARARSVLAGDHARLTDALRKLSDQHATTVMLARTLLQPASPTTFGLKAAGWHALISRTWTLLAAAAEEALVLQFGGASGTLAALSPHGPAVAANLARKLGLRDPGAPWHTQRDRLAALVAACGIYTGALGKLARDVSLLMQDELGEVSEPGGSSSSMPHKRNPAGCAAILAAATRAPGLVSAFLAGMPQENERGLGGWHAEASTISEIVQTTGAALAAAVEVVHGLNVNDGRMRANIDRTNGVVFAERATMVLAPALGREAAARLIAVAIDTARREGRTFGSVLADDDQVLKALDPGTLATLDAADEYLGSAEHFRRRLLEES